MNRKETWKKLIEKIWKGRAAMITVIAVTVFLCCLTIFEFTALRMEWDIPVLSKITGGADSYLFEEYRNVEMALDESTENILLEDTAGEQELVTDSINEEKAEQGAEDFDNFSDNNNSSTTVNDSENDFGTGSANSSIENENSTGLVDNGNQETDTLEEEFPYYIKINRKQNCITVYSLDENGEYTDPYKAIICSTGLYNATPLGTFHLSTKYLWRELYGNVYGQYATRITGGVLFHSVPYYRRNKNALCTDKYNKLGQQASMGCVRLTVEDAKWIADNCPSGTTVEIYDDDDPGPLGKPAAAKIDTDSPNKGWDPTDPDTENPWHQTSDDR